MPINVSDDDDVTNWLKKKGQQQFKGQWWEAAVGRSRSSGRSREQQQEQQQHVDKLKRRKQLKM